jgi:uncharacterized repeat protein (TIGR01451 family)
MFTRETTAKDEITLSSLPSGWTESSNSTSFVRVINTSPAGATATELQTFLRGSVQIAYDSSKKGHGIMVIISEQTGDANRNLYYFSDNKHWYEYVEEFKDPSTGISKAVPYEWWEAYNLALDARFMGMSGYLATITYKKEDDFIWSITSGKKGWIGGTRANIRMAFDSDKKHLLHRPSYKDASTVDKDSFFTYWYWASGPEYDATRNEDNNGLGDPLKARFDIGITYSKGSASGTEYPFANWQSLKPDNNTTAIDGGQQYVHLGYLEGSGWNDYGVDGYYLKDKGNNQKVQGYIIEYEGTINAPTAEGVVGFYNTKDAYLNGAKEKNNGTETSPVEVLFGDKIKYVLNVYNTSVSDQKVTVVDTIKRGFDYVPNSATKGGVLNVSGSDSVLVWNLTEVPFENITELSYEVTPRTKESLIIRNTAEATSNGNIISRTNSTWHKAKLFKVNFEAVPNGSFINGDPQYIDYGGFCAEGVIPVPDTHYKFVGWSHNGYTDYRDRTKVSVPSKSNITDYTTINITNDVTLTANFEIITHTITYDGNDNDNTSGTVPAAETHNTHTEPALVSNALTKTNATFIGWSAIKTPLVAQASEKPADLKQPGEQFLITSDTTFYAVWAKDEGGIVGGPDDTPDYEQVKMLYNKTLADEGNAPVDGNLYNTSNTVTVKGNEGTPRMTQTEATFIGWSFTDQTVVVASQETVPSDIVQPSDPFEIVSDTTLYAVWAIDKTGPGGIHDSVPDYLQYEVIYNRSLATVSGNVPVDGNLYNSGNSVTVKGNEGSPKLELTEATFIGWSFTEQTAVITSQETVPSDIIQPSSSFEIVSDTTLYAVWAIDKTGPGGNPDHVPDYLQYEVIYNKSLEKVSGDVPVDGNLYNSGNSVTVKGNEGSPKLELTEATFIGWSFTGQTAVITSQETVPSDIIQPSSSFKIVSDTTLYAVWAIDRTGPGGIHDSVPDYLQYEVIYNRSLATVSGNVPVDGNLYNSENRVTVKGDEGSPKLKLTEATFIGWSFTGQTAVIASPAAIPSDIIQPSASFEIVSDTALYAVWALDKTGPDGVPDSIPDFGQASVIYNKTLATSGTVPIDNNLYNITNTVTVKTNEGSLALPDACFSGWSFTNQTAVITSAVAVPTNRILPTNMFLITTDTILYAVWSEDKSGPDGISDDVPDYLQFKVKYDGNGNTGGSVPVDGKLYNNNNNVIIYGNTGILAKPNACFIGWSSGQKPVITVPGDEPVDLKQGGDDFNIISDTTFYAVWAEDRSGPDGIPDSIPDYLQYAVIYDGNSHTGGSAPVDIKLYNTGDIVTILGNTGILTKTNTCFIGWSYNAHTPVQSVATIPSDLVQENDVFTITTSGLTLHAVWAEDTNGPDGIPDSVPDYFQVKITYGENSSFVSTGGSLPAPNPTMPTMNTSAMIKGNTGGLSQNYSDRLALAGWTKTDGWGIVETAAQTPPDLLYAGDILPVETSDIDLYVVWAYDRNGNGIPDFNEPEVSVTPEHVWPQQEPVDPENPGIYPPKPEWKPEYEALGKDSWITGCDLCFTITVDPDPYRDRIFKLNYLGALKKEYVVDRNTGKPLEDYYVLPKGQSTYTIYFAMTDVPEEQAGQTGALEAEIAGGGSDVSSHVQLYNQPSYDLIIVKPVVSQNGNVDLGITGGSPNMMRSINGHGWRNVNEPLSDMERLSVAEGVSIWLREPGGCWEAQFFFASYGKPEVLRYVEMPYSQDVITNPGSGKHYVSSNKDFTFTASFPGGIPLKIMAQGFYSGMNQELVGQNLDDGTYKYVIPKVMEPWTVSFGSEPASGTTGEQHIDGLSVWSYRNTLNIRSDIKTKAFIYTLSGFLYKYVDIKEGDNKEILNRGIYMIVIGNNRYKVIIN